MSSSKYHPKLPPREAPPSLMGDAAVASMPGAFPQGGIEMMPPEQRIQDKIQKMDDGTSTGTRPGSVVMTGPGMPSGKNGANANGKSVYSADKSSTEECVINNDNTHQLLSDDTYKKEQRWVFGIMLGLLLMVCIVIPVVVLTAGDNLQATDEGMSTALVEDDEDVDPRLIIPGLSNATVQAIVTDHHSPQFMAFLWIKLDPHLQDYEDWRIEQRFAMSVLYYSWGGIDTYYGSLQVWLSYWTPECEWMGKRYNLDRDRPYCNDDGQVVTLYVDRMFMGGIILPPEIALLPRLILIDLSHTPFHGDFDTFFSLVPQLSHVLPNLEQLVLVDSEIDGTIPAQALSTLSSSLNVLELSANKMTGSVPIELGLLTALKDLDLSGNLAVNGTLPEELGSLVATLEYMDITETGITGEIPWELCQKQKAGELEIRADCSLVQCCDRVRNLSG